VHVVVVGGGVAGLGTALSLARTGHRVTILERDDTPMPPTADAAFSWQRTGAPQVRHSHAFLARLRNLLRDRAPDVLEELYGAGATELPFTENLPDTLTDRSPAAGDEDLVAIACRRTTFEWVLRRVVLAETDVELRHGAAAHALDAEMPAGHAVPCVRGVDGIAADLVVDARGPRSSSDEWLHAIGAQPVPERLHESGIVYFSRFYRMRPDAEPPAVVGPAAADLGYLKFAIFLGDNGTFSITYAVDRDDETFRKALAEPAQFEAVAHAIEAIAPWRAPDLADPITDVHIMAGLRNRSRPFVVDDAPLALGFVPVGDASVSTNPLYGRGCSLALVDAFGLADALREHGDDLDAVARAHFAFVGRELMPWFRSAVVQDEQARAMAKPAAANIARADADAAPPSNEDPRAFMQEVFREGLLPALRTSPIVFRAFLRWFNLLVTPDALMSDQAVVGEVLAAYQDRENRPAPPPIGPDRDEMVAVLTQ
jgi:2-polyprenyl-6-methoxyphenol hydroxylase-like FAD-dependent oxidoreductase